MVKKKNVSRRVNGTANPGNINLHIRYESTNPTHDECQFFTDSTVEAEMSGTNADQFQCLLLEDKPQESGLTEVRPVMVTSDFQDSTDDLQNERLTYMLPKNSLFKAGARRITIEGSFFGTDLSEFLDAEVGEDFLKYLVISFVTGSCDRKPKAATW